VPEEKEMDIDDCDEEAIGVSANDGGPIFQVDESSAAGNDNNVLNGIIHQASDYMVPSQMSQPVPAQGMNMKADFMPHYESLCKMADGTGNAGHSIMEKGLNELRQKQMDIVAKKKITNTDSNAYSEYMHLYDSVCAYGDEAGEEGYEAMRTGMMELKRQQVNANVRENGNGRPAEGMASMPQTNKKKEDKRIPSRCSPNKKR
jgi:hypothetical protein